TCAGISTNASCISACRSICLAAPARRFGRSRICHPTDHEEAEMKKTRIMPAGHWDWSMPVKFSQGWAIEGHVRWIIVGGQISADEHGRTIGKGDIGLQTRKVFESLKKGLAEAGGPTADSAKPNCSC